MKFIVKITETLEKKVLVEADNEEKALSSVELMYATEKIVLDAGDYTGYTIEVSKETEEEFNNK